MMMCKIFEICEISKNVKSYVIIMNFAKTINSTQDYVHYNK